MHPAVLMRMQHRSYSDRTFDMLYDMIPEKVERYIFLPFLQGKFREWEKEGKEDTYWEYLADQYPAIYHEEGHTGESYINDAQSFLYGSEVRKVRKHYNRCAFENM